MKKMKFSIGRRVCALALAAVTALSVTACGGKDQGNGQQQEVREWAYVPEFVSIEEENVSFYNLQLIGDKMYYVSWDWNEETGSTQNVCRYSLASQKAETMALKWPDEENMPSIESVVPMEDGSLYVFCRSYGEEGEKQYLGKFDAEGNSLFLNELASEKSGSDGEVIMSYAQSVSADGQGRLYMCGSQGEVALFDAEGNAAGTFSLGSGDIYIQQACKGSDGKMYVVYTVYDGSGSSTFLADIDFEGKKTGTTYENFPGSTRHIVADPEGDFLVSDDNSVYSYDLKKQEKTKLFDWLDSDINGSYVQAFGLLEDGRLAAVYEDWSMEDRGVALLTKKKASEVPQKENITVATISGGYELRSLAVMFNKASDKYHISVNQYIDFDNYNENSWSDAITRLNNDITSGNTPDIIDVSDINVEQLAGKGVFEDLYGYLEKSSTLSRSDFMENMLEAYTYNDKLVCIPASFSLQTLMGHKSKIGDREGWTLQEMIEYADANPEAELFDQVSKREMLGFLLRMNEDEFVDWGEGECHFESDDFKSLLSFVNRYPDEVNYNEDTPVTPIRIQNGEVLLYPDSIYDFRSIQESLSIFNQDMVCIGFPTVDGSSGHAFIGRNLYAITSKSDSKEGAWEFIESVLNGADNERMSNGFPTIKSKLEAKAAEALKIEYVLDENGEPYLDENGEPVIKGAGGGIGWGDWFYEYHHTTQEEVDIVMDLMSKAKPMAYNDNDEIMTIILEEAEPFFKGQKSVDEVAGIIQNRANIYIKENR